MNIPDNGVVSLIYVVIASINYPLANIINSDNCLKISLKRKEIFLPLSIVRSSFIWLYILWRDCLLNCLTRMNILREICDKTFYMLPEH